jgi:CelD/BcsL family acetyltransferase involved in cellulose biosynthesis
MNPSAMECGPSRARLKFLFGEFLVLDLWLPALVYQVPFPPEADFACLPEHLISAAGDSSVIIVAPSWPVDQGQKTLSIVGRYLQYIPAIRPRYFISLSGTFEEYFARTFQSKGRKHILRCVRRLEEGDGEFRVFKTVPEMEAFLIAAQTISKRTYQTKMLGVGLPQSPEFQRSTLERAGSDRVRGYLLSYQQQPAAFAYCECKNLTLSYSVIGYDPQFASLSPGTVLLYYIVKHVFNEGRFRWLDFGIGESQYKSTFSTDFRTCGDVYLFPLGPKGVVIALSHWALDTVSTLLGRFFARLGVKTRIRKWLRAAHGNE